MSPVKPQPTLIEFINRVLCYGLLGWSFFLILFFVFALFLSPFLR